MAIKVLIVDDHQVFSSSLKMVLASNNFDVESVYNAKDALKYLKAISYDILLTDIEMPETNGVELIKQIKSQPIPLKNVPKIIVLTSNKKLGLFQKLYKLGVHGFLSKNVTQLELLKALHKVMANEKYFDSHLYDQFLNTTNTKTAVEFTDRELDVLKLILDEKTTAEIANELDISPYTVEGHRKNLMQKTNAKNVVGLIKYSLNNNLF